MFAHFPDGTQSAEQGVEVNLVEVGLQVDGVVKGPQDFKIGGGTKVDFHEKGPDLVNARQARRAGRPGNQVIALLPDAKELGGRRQLIECRQCEPGFITWGHLSRPDYLGKARS